MTLHYEVGDRVLIRPDLDNFEVDDFIESLNWDGVMSDYAGMEATITQVHTQSYNIDIDDGTWFWSEDTFMPTGTERDLQNANKHVLWGRPYHYFDDNIFTPTIHSIPNEELRRRIIRDMRKLGIDV